jgi:hypothetical protein
VAVQVAKRGRGAARDRRPLPWHASHAAAVTSTTPSTWRAGTKVPPAATTAPWHGAHDLRRHAPAGGWAPPGGRPWQVPHAAWLPSTRVQVGVVSAPPGNSVAPWQYVLVQVVPSNAGFAPSALRERTEP